VLLDPMAVAIHVAVKEARQGSYGATASMHPAASTAGTQPSEVLSSCFAATVNVTRSVTTSTTSRALTAVTATTVVCTVRVPSRLQSLQPTSTFSLIKDGTGHH
jgi:hypothetical protein